MKIEVTAPMSGIFYRKPAPEDPAYVEEVARLGPGPCFGEMALIEIAPRSASVRAEEPIVTLALYSNSLTPAQLTLVADPAITRELRAIPGVADVTVSGGVKRELTIER